MQTVPGIQEAQRAASILAETGADMQQFPSAKRLEFVGRSLPGQQPQRRQKQEQPHHGWESMAAERAHRMRVGSSGHQELFSQGQVLEPDQPVGWSQGSRSGRRRARHVDPHLSRARTTKAVREPAGAAARGTAEATYDPPSPPTPGQARPLRTLRSCHHSPEACSIGRFSTH